MMVRRRGLTAETDRLIVAVPRGVLLPGALDVLDTLGFDTAEARANDRRQLFLDAGIMTMRPGDVVTYVASGSADLGIVGKDILMETPDSGVYELADLGYGRCKMVLATQAEDPREDALKHLGAIRIGTKYPNVALRYGERERTQVEIVELKGSVEVAPLVQLVDAIIDLAATGRTLEENGLVVRDELAVCTARLIANPVSYSVKAERIAAVLERLEDVRTGDEVDGSDGGPSAAG